MQRDGQRNERRKKLIWSTPKLEKLGTMRSVAPGPPGLSEGASGKS